ncbi:hypothetical protein DA2_3808 [Desulfovibrio sp. A2]|nr:hypothetical protein DA2_3808 [Desulfovibrio sp. A2]
MDDFSFLTDRAGTSDGADSPATGDLAGYAQGRGDGEAAAPAFAPPSPSSSVRSAKRGEDFSFLTDQPDPMRDAARASVRLARETGMRPEHEAEARALSRRTGLPAPMVREDMDTARIIDVMHGVDVDLNDAPGTAAYLADPDRAALSFDDTGNLSLLERMGKRVAESGTARAYQAGVYQTDVLGPLYNRQMQHVLANGAEDADLARIIHEKELFQPDAPEADGILDTVLYASAGQVPVWGKLLAANIRGALEGGSAGAAAAAVGGPATLPLAPATAVTGAAVGRDLRAVQAAFDLEADAAYGEFRALKDENGEGLDPRIAAWGAQAVGTLNASLEHLGFKTFAGFVPGGAQALTGTIRRAVADGLRSTPVRAALLGVLRDYAMTVGTEAATEMGQEAVNILVGEAGKRLSEGLQGTHFGALDWSAATDRIREAGVQGAAATLGLGAGPAVTRVATDVREAGRSVRFRDAQAQINEAVHATQTMQRDPEAMREFLQIAGLGEDAYIAPEGVQRLARSAPDVFQQLGVDADHAAVATEGGQALRVNTALLHTALSQEQFNQVVDDIKPAPGAMSVREGASLDPQATVAALDAAARDGFAAVQEVRRLEGEVRAAFAAVGLPGNEDAVDANVTLVTRMARRLATPGDPQSFLRNLTILADAATGVAEDASGNDALLQAAKKAIYSDDRSVKMVFEETGVEPSLTDRGQLRQYLESLDPKEVKRLKLQDGQRYTAVLRSIVRKVFPTEGGLRFRREGEAVDYAHFVGRDNTRNEYIGTLLSTLKDQDIQVEFTTPEGAAKGYMIRKYFDPDIQKDIWDMLVIQDNELKTKIARKDRRGAGYIEGQIVGAGDTASQPATVGGATEIASTPRNVTEDNIDNSNEDGKPLAQDEGSTLFQPNSFVEDADVTPRGRMSTLSDGTRIVRLLQGADASTLPHELAHVFLEELRLMVNTGKAGPELVADLEAIDRWTARQVDRNGKDWQRFYSDAHAQGVDKATAEEKADWRAGHEAFARGFEAYLWEGRAPEPELEGAFRRFRRWLREVYKDVKALGVALDPEIRSVFDRMVQAETEIDAAMVDADLAPLSDSLARSLGVTPEDREYMRRLFNEARVAADEALVRDRNRGLRGLRAAWFREAVEAAKDAPGHRMVTALRKGRGLDRAEFLAKYGEEAAKGLPPKVLRTDGLSLDEAALEHDFDRHEQMVNALWDYRKPADVAREEVERLTAERDATFLPETYLARTEEFAAFMEIKARYLKAGVVGAPAGKQPAVIARQVMRAYARGIIRGMPLRDAMRHDLFLAAMASASRDESAAATRDNWKRASEAAERSRLNHAYARESVNIRDEVDATMALARKLGRLKQGKIGEGHHKALLGVLDRFGLYAVDADSYADAPALSTLLADESLFGEDGAPTFSPWLVEGGERMDWRALSAGEMEEVRDLVTFLHGAGKEALAPRLVAADLKMADAVAQLASATRNAPKRGVKRHEGTWLRKLQDWKDSFISQNRTLLWIARELDGYMGLAKGGKTGPMERLFIDPLERAYRERKDLQQAVYTRVSPAIEQLARSAMEHPAKASLVDLPVPASWERQGRTWDYEACLALFLNWGNEGNRKRIMQGHGLTEADVQQVLALFSQEDARAVQTIWDTLDDVLWPRIAETHQALKHFTPGKVEASAFTMPDGTVMRGGYYPLKYDAASDVRAARNEDVQKALEAPATGMVPKSVASGSTKGRSESAGGRPVLLRLGVLSAHLEWAAHYATHAAVVHDMNRFFSRQDVAEIVKDVAGEDVYGVVREMIGRIANPRAGEMPTTVDKTIGWVQGGAAVYAMWGNRLGAVQQVTALGNYVAAEGGIAEGAATWMRGAAHFLSDPVGSWRLLQEMSPVMRDHLTFVTRTLAEAGADDLKDITIGRGALQKRVVNAKEAVTRGGMALYAMMDAVVSAPGWYGSYLKGLDLGMSPGQAQDRATKVMAEYTPMNREMDRTLLQNRRGLAVMWTWMSGFFAKNYNTISGYTKAWRQGAIDTRRFVGEVVAVRLLPPLVTSILYTLVRGDDDDRDRMLMDAGFDVVAYQFNGLPLVRDAATYGVNVARAVTTGDRKGMQRNPFQLPGVMAVQLAQKVGNAGIKLVEDFGDEDRQVAAALALAEIMGFAVKVPAPKLVREVLQGWEDMESEEGSVLNLLLKPKFKR